MTIYPNHPWDIQKFDKMPKRYWDGNQNIMKFLEQLKHKLNIKDTEDWYKITQTNFHGMILLLFDLFYFY